MTTDQPAALDGAHPSPPSTSHRRRRRARLLIILVATIAVVFSILVLLDALAVARDLRSGRRAFAALADGGFGGGGDKLTVQAGKAARLLADADRRADRSPWIGALSKVPFLGRPARWLRSASDTAASLGDAAAESVRTIEPLLDSGGDPAARLELVRTLEAEFVRLHRIVRDVRLPSSGGFLPPVSSADRELRGDLARLRRAIADGAVAARGLRTFLAGPTRYVVLAANNSEMRSGGMVLQVGVLDAVAGRVSAGNFRSTAELKLPESVPVPAELESLYGWLEPGKEWRNAGTSPNFPATAPIYAAMAQRTGLSRVDGVLQIDVLGVRSLLEVIGPISVEGRRYDASNVEKLMMHDLYVAYGDVQFERRHEFSRLAAEAFRKLTERTSDLSELAKAVRDAAAGRHLLLWSSRPNEQKAWERLALDGRLARDGLMVTVQNHGGNKLDWFVRASVDLTLERREGKLRRITARIRIDNPTPKGEPLYVAGDGGIVPKGAYRAFVSVYLPGWATNVGWVNRKPLVVGTDGPMRVVATRFDIGRGGFAVAELVFDVPDEIARILVLPSARSVPVPFRLNGRSVDDSVARPVTL